MPNSRFLLRRVIVCVANAGGFPDQPASERPYRSSKWAKQGRDYCPGSPCWSSSSAVRNMLEAVPELRGDPDLGATNEGVTILWLK
jgi:hypothetical protein